MIDNKSFFGFCLWSGADSNQPYVPTPRQGFEFRSGLTIGTEYSGTSV